LKKDERARFELIVVLGAPPTVLKDGHYVNDPKGTPQKTAFDKSSFEGGNWDLVYQAFIPDTFKTPKKADGHMFIPDGCSRNRSLPRKRRSMGMIERTDGSRFNRRNFSDGSRHSNHPRLSGAAEQAEARVRTLTLDPFINPWKAHTLERHVHRYSEVTSSGCRNRSILRPGLYRCPELGEIAWRPRRFDRPRRRQYESARQLGGEDAVGGLLHKDATIRSNTGVCLEVVDPAITELAPDAQASFAKSLASLLEKEKVAYDVGAYRDAPPGLRSGAARRSRGRI
jgi:hypothetical protein